MNCLGLGQHLVGGIGDLREDVTQLVVRVIHGVRHIRDIVVGLGGGVHRQVTVRQGAQGVLDREHRVKDVPAGADNQHQGDQHCQSQHHHLHSKGGGHGMHGFFFLFGAVLVHQISHSGQLGVKVSHTLGNLGAAFHGASSLDGLHIRGDLIQRSDEGLDLLRDSI